LWISCAKTSANFNGHPYQKQVNKLVASIEQQKRLTDALPLWQKQLILTERLRTDDSQVALAAFWLLIQAEHYAPRLNQPFNHWHWMPLTLEFDHQGHLCDTDDDTIYYEGGESKASSSCTYNSSNRY
jgi:hypothetical protein